jgi:hypothetical protein
MLAKYIQQLVKELEMQGSLATEVPGVYDFPIDEEISVTISDIPQGFTMTSTFADAPSENEELFYTQALLANLYGEGTEGCILGLDAEGEKLILSRKIDYNIEYKEFKDLIEDFLNNVEFWRDEVKVYGTKVA